VLEKSEKEVKAKFGATAKQIIGKSRSPRALRNDADSRTMQSP
jgi:hypothetical protein